MGGRAEGSRATFGSRLPARRSLTHTLVAVLSCHWYGLSPDVRLIRPELSGVAFGTLLSDVGGVVRASFRFFPESRASDHARVLDLLRDNGVEPDLSPSSDSPSLAVFGSQTADLIEYLRDGANRCACVLAVCVSGSSPPSSLCWTLISAGAADVYWWHGSRDAPAEIHARLERWHVIDTARRSDVVRDHMIGASRAWIAVLRELIEIAMFGTNSCLLEGESGTGKELAARLIHTLDRRENKKELVIVDCSTLVPELSGSEFFGHERGAYTGAVGGRDGAFALANGGTLFLDEVGELPHSLQAQLLRLIQEGTYKRVGGNEWRRTEFRLVCATNRDLNLEVNSGRFRSDLYHRIAGAVVRMPPLRERRADILPLAHHFLNDLLPDQGKIAIAPAVESWLLERDYGGNVRELRQVVARMCRRHAGPGPFTPGDVAAEDRPATACAGSDWRADALEHAIERALRDGASLKEIGREAANCAIRLALASAGGNLHLAAQQLEVTDRALQIRRSVQRESGDPLPTGRVAGAKPRVRS